MTSQYDRLEEVATAALAIVDKGVGSLQIQPDFEEPASDSVISEKRHINMWSMFLPASRSKELSNADTDPTQPGLREDPEAGNRTPTGRCSLSMLQEEATLPIRDLKTRYGIPLSPARNDGDDTSPDYIPLDCGDKGSHSRIFETAAVLKKRISNAGNKIRKRRGARSMRAQAPGPEPRSKREQAPSPEPVSSPSLMTDCVSGPASNPPSNPTFNPPTGPSFNPPSGPRFGPPAGSAFGSALGPRRLPEQSNADPVVEEPKASAVVEQLPHGGKPLKRVRFDVPDDLTPNCASDKSSSNGNPGTSVGQVSAKQQRTALKGGKLRDQSKVLGGRVEKASSTRLKGEKKATWRKRLATLGVNLPHGINHDNTIRNFRIVIQDCSDAVQFATSLIETPHPSGQSSAAVTLGPRIVFYTDGSHRSRTLGGAAVTYTRCIPEPTDWIDASASVLGTINATDEELLAIGLALHIARHEIMRLSRAAPAQKDTWPTIFVVTDSQTSLTWIKDCLLGKSNSFHGHYLPKYQQLVNSLSQLEKLGAKVEFHWTKGHSTVEGNIRADMLAGIASGLMQDYVKKIGWKPKLAIGQYYVRIAIGTSLDVLRMFEAHNEDIALLLGGLPEDKHTESHVVTNELLRTQLLQEGLILDKLQGNKGNVVKTLWYKMISPMGKLVHSITGHKRKHSDLSNSEVMESAKVVNALPDTSKVLPDIPEAREDCPSSQTKTLPAVPTAKALPDTSKADSVLSDVRDFENLPGIPRDTASSLMSRAQDLPGTSIVKTLPARPVFLDVTPTTRAQLNPGAPGVSSSSDTANANAISDWPMFSAFPPRTREQSQPNPPRSTKPAGTTSDEAFSDLAVPDNARILEFSLPPRANELPGTSAAKGPLASPQEKVEAKVEVIDLTRDSLEEVSDANRVAGTIGGHREESKVKVDYVIHQEDGHDVIDLTGS